MLSKQRNRCQGDLSASFLPSSHLRGQQSDLRASEVSSQGKLHATPNLKFDRKMVPCYFLVDPPNTVEPQIQTPRNTLQRRPLVTHFHYPYLSSEQAGKPNVYFDRMGLRLCLEKELMEG